MDGPTLEIYLDRVRSFELNEREVAQVAEHLRGTTNDRARFKCIMILRRQGTRAHVPLVAPLVHSADTDVANEAMCFLVHDTERADLCRDTLLEWLADEGEFSFKPLDAVQIAGEVYLQRSSASTLASSSEGQSLAEAVVFWVSFSRRSSSFMIAAHLTVGRPDDVR